MNNNVIWAIVLLVIFFSLSQNNGTVVIQDDSSSSVDNINLIDADISFTGVNKYVTGTSLTNEEVRVFRFNDVTKDLGTRSLNSGTLAVTPNANYRFYFFMNDSKPSDYYYVDVQDYTAKEQDSVDNIIGHGCEIDTNPVVAVRASSGQTQTASSNAQSLAASATADLEIDVKSHVDKCYGTPGAPKGNAICFNYNSAAISDITMNTNFVGVPTSVSSLSLGTVKCYEFNVLEDGAKQTLTVHLQAGSTEPTISHNISIFTDDIAFDLNAENLNEIWGFTDESGNQLARSINGTPDGYIYIS